MRKTREWRTDEERIIRENCKTMNAEEMTALLIHRSANAIRMRACQMNIKLRTQVYKTKVNAGTIGTIRGIVRKKGLPAAAKMLGVNEDWLRRKIYRSKN